MKISEDLKITKNFITKKMITIEQENQIELYLRSKKLSPQILIEVKDHFLSQISNLMDAEDLSFQEALLKAQISWKYELEMVKADILSFKKIARIERNLLQKRFNTMMVKSLLLSLVFAILYVISDDTFFYFQIFSLIAFVIIVLFGIISKKINFREYQRMSLHPLILRNIILGIILFPLGCYFSGNFQFWEPALNQLIIFYSLTIQIQLLYFKTKKVNVLI